MLLRVQRVKGGRFATPCSPTTSLAEFVALAFAIVIADAWATNAWEALLAIKDDRWIVVDEVAGVPPGWR